MNYTELWVWTLFLLVLASDYCDLFVTVLNSNHFQASNVLLPSYFEITCICQFSLNPWFYCIIFFFSFPGTNFCNSYLVLILVLLPTCHVFLYWTSLQALFRKIAAALPGMETLSSAKQEDMVDVNLKSSTGSAQSQPQSSGCSCWICFFLCSCTFLCHAFCFMQVSL